VVGNGRWFGGESTPWLAYLPGPVSWTSLSSDWSNPANWSQGFVPDLYDDVTIAPDLFVTVDLPAGARELDTLALGQSGNQEPWTSRLRAPAGSQLTVYGVTTIRERGTLDMAGGQLNGQRLDNYGAVSGGGFFTTPFYNYGSVDIGVDQTLHGTDWVQYPGASLYVAPGGRLSVAYYVANGGNASGPGEVSVSGPLVAYAPANFAGDLTLVNPLGSQMLLNITGGSPVPVTKLSVGGELTLAGSLVVNRSFFATYNAGDEFDLLDWGTLNGQFSSVTVDPVAGLAWDLSQLYTTGVIRLVGNQADFNSDGQVNVADYEVWVANYGAIAATPSQGDANGDGFVDAADYTVWRDALAGDPPTTATSQAIPEPAGAALVLAAFALAARRGGAR
jgi:hypothetical protein